MSADSSSTSIMMSPVVGENDDSLPYVLLIDDDVSRSPHVLLIEDNVSITNSRLLFVRFRIRERQRRPWAVVSGEDIILEARWVEIGAI